MKQLIEAFKSARKTEIILIVSAICALLLCLAGASPKSEITTPEEERMQRILSRIDGAGSVRVMLSSNEDGEHRGAIVVAPGAEEIEVQLKLQQAIHTLTGLELDQIEVVKSKR